MSDETERYRQDNRSPVLHFEMVRRKPAAALAGGLVNELARSLLC